MSVCNAFSDFWRSRPLSQAALTIHASLCRRCNLAKPSLCVFDMNERALCCVAATWEFPQQLLVLLIITDHRKRDLLGCRKRQVADANTAGVGRRPRSRPATAPTAAAPPIRERPHARARAGAALRRLGRGPPAVPVFACLCARAGGGALAAPRSRWQREGGHHPHRLKCGHHRRAGTRVPTAAARLVDRTGTLILEP